MYQILIPITLFACIAYSIKTVVDAYTRRRIIETRGSEELVRSLLEGEANRRRLASLHWGCVLVALAVYVCFSAAGKIAKALGSTGINIMTRLMGLILAALAVETMADGLSALFPALRAKRR